MQGMIFGDLLWTLEKVQAPSAGQLKHFMKPVPQCKRLKRKAPKKALCAALHPDMLSSQSQPCSVLGAARGCCLLHFAVTHGGQVVPALLFLFA